MPTLTHDLALLDLVSQAKTAEGADRLHERAHHLAAVHQVATPTEVDCALAMLTPAHQVYAWDRPSTLAERETRQVERQRRVVEEEAKRPKRRWYHHVDSISGMLIGAVLTAVLSIGGTLVLTMTPGPFEIPPGNWVFGEILGFGMLGFAGGCGLWALHDRWHANQEPAHAYRRRCEVEDACEQSVTPTAGQAERWLAFPEVAAQARAWMGSEIGLMAEDVRRLDARTAELANATQKDRQAQALAQLQGGLTQAPAPIQRAIA